MAKTMGPPLAPDTTDGLYFKIVCDPGHERTTRELRQLPRESRERVWADMTGDPSTSNQKTDSEENPQFLQQHLETMNEELLKMNDNEALQCKIARDPAFRLMFLRADDFDPYKAVQRMVRHFDQKCNLFGKEKIGRDIRLKDLSPDDMESLACGSLQFLPRTDRAGRLVFVSRYRSNVYKEKENSVRNKGWIWGSPESCEWSLICLVCYILFQNPHLAPCPLVHAHVLPRVPECAKDRDCHCGV
jgi:hypothetical protein